MKTEKIMVRIAQALTLYIFILASISVAKFWVALFVVVMCSVVMAYLETKRKEIIR